METIQKIALIFTICGALNWGLIGFFDFNLVKTLFAENDTMIKIVYALVGIGGILNLGLLFSPIDNKKK